MANEVGAGKRGISRRQFLTLAGAGAVVGALILAATRKQGIQGLMKAIPGAGANQATAGKVIRTPSQVAGPSLLQRLFGGRL